MNSRERIMGLFKGEKVDRVACFSGMGTVWGPALDEYRYNFADVHRESEKMARIAAYPAEAFNYECAVVPFDVCVETEVLGCVTNFYCDPGKRIYPKTIKRVIESADCCDIDIPEEIRNRGRIPVVMDAIRILKDGIGKSVPVGAFILGPYTLAGQIMDLAMLLMLTVRKPQQVNDLLLKMNDFLTKVAACYQEAGADYICIREMSAATNLIPPQIFTDIVKPHLERLLSSIQVPKVLHICGNTLKIIPEMIQCGAEAISIENKGRFAEARKLAGDALVFGNLPGFGVMVHGTPEDVEKEVIRCLKEGSDGIWPDDEISLNAPAANLEAMVKAVEKYGADLWLRK